MQALFQLGGTPQQRPFWHKLAAFLCLLLVIAASTAQAFHVHDDILRATKNTPQGPTVPDHCPLCVAMHSAVTANTDTAPQPLLFAESLRPAPANTGHSAVRSFDLQTRPPPTA